MRPGLLVTAVVVMACCLVGLSASSSASVRVDVGHGLSISVPPGWRVSYRRFTPCSDRLERFSLIRGRQVLMLQERLDPVRAELVQRPARFSVRGKPSQMECCSVPGRTGWSLQFGDHGRGFYADLYPGDSPVTPLLQVLDSLQVT